MREYNIGGHACAMLARLLQVELTELRSRLQEARDGSRKRGFDSGRADEDHGDNNHSNTTTNNNNNNNNTSSSRSSSPERPACESAAKQKANGRGEFAGSFACLIPFCFLARASMRGACMQANELELSTPYPIMKGPP